MKNVFFIFLPQLSLPRKLKIKNLLLFSCIFLANVIKEFNKLHYKFIFRLHHSWRPNKNRAKIQILTIISGVLFSVKLSKQQKSKHE